VKVLAILLTALAVAFALTSLGLGIAAIWTSGTVLSDRLSNTSGVAFFVAFFVGLGSVPAWLAWNDQKRRSGR
jgi:hypothetical protein